MTGKIVPYIVIGLIQATIILLAARYMFDVPFVGSVVTLYVAALLFIACNLTVGITLSSLAQNQLQAMQLTFFYFLPNILLSGFMFPFRGMPDWAQCDRQRAAAHALQPPGARHPAQGQRLARPVAEHLAADRVHGRRDGRRAAVLPQDARLKRRAPAPAVRSPALRCAGCTVGPDFRTPDPPSVDRYAPAPGRRDVAGSKRARDRDIPAEWWTLFGSPALDALVRRALAQQPDARPGARAARRGARSCAPRAPARRSSRGERARCGVNRAADRSGDARLPAGAESRARSLSTASARRRLLHVRPLRRHAARARGARRAKSTTRRYELEAARLTLAANVVTTAIRLAGLRAQIEATEAILAAQRRQLAIVEQRYALGGVAQARRARTSARSSRRRARRCRRCRAQRAQAITCSRSTWATPPAAAPSCPRSGSPSCSCRRELPLRLPSELARQRPDIRASEALLHKASAERRRRDREPVSEARRSRGSLRRSQLSLSDLFGNGINVWSIGANLAAAAVPRRRAAGAQARRGRRVRPGRGRLSGDGAAGPAERRRRAARALEADTGRRCAARTSRRRTPTTPIGSSSAATTPAA